MFKRKVRFLAMLSFLVEVTFQLYISKKTDDFTCLHELRTIGSTSREEQNGNRIISSS